MGPGFGVIVGYPANARDDLVGLAIALIPQFYRLTKIEYVNSGCGLREILIAH